MVTCAGVEGMGLGLATGLHLVQALAGIAAASGTIW